MKTFKIKWQKRDKYLPLQRNTIIKASSETDAKAALYREMGNEKKVDILEVTEVENE